MPAQHRSSSRQGRSDGVNPPPTTASYTGGHRPIQCPWQGGVFEIDANLNFFKQDPARVETHTRRRGDPDSSQAAQKTANTRGTEKMGDNTRYDWNLTV